MTIENNKQCFVQLWLRLECTRQLFGQQYRRFCIRRILKSWLGPEVTDEFIWQVCFNTVVDEEQIYGYDELPPPTLHPRPSREFLRALVAVKLGIGMRKVDLRALDAAYSEAFPGRRINVNKKKRKD